MKVQTFPEAFGGLIALNFAHLALQSRTSVEIRVIVPCPHEMNNIGVCEAETVVTMEGGRVVRVANCPHDHLLTYPEYRTVVRSAGRELHAHLMGVAQ